MYCIIFLKKCARKSSSESQQAMAILKAGKLEDGSEKQKLVSSLSRGALVSITEPAQKVFSRTEHYFRHSTFKSASLQRVDIIEIAQKSASDSDVLHVSSYQTMVSEAELVPTKNVCKTRVFFVKTILMYVVVCIFFLSEMQLFISCFFFFVLSTVKVCF